MRSAAFSPVDHKLFFTLQGNVSPSYNFVRIQQFIHGNKVSEDRILGFGINAGIAQGISNQLSLRFLADLSLSNLLTAGYLHTEK